MLRIILVEPTVLFAREKGRLLQTINITIENPASPIKADLEFVAHSSSTVCRLGLIDHGKKTYQISVPDLRDPIPIKFSLKIGDQVQDELVMDWKPRKHWEVFMTPIAHHDLGYTDTIEGVLRKYCCIYEDVLRFCEETENWPEESRFHYMIEEAWSIQHFLEQCSAEKRAKLARYAQEGRIEIPALFGNEISVLCGHEELIRLMYPSFRLGRELGAKIKSAAVTDIPGLSWGLPTALAGAGIKYFFAGLPQYFEAFEVYKKNDIHSLYKRDEIHSFWDEASILRPHGRPDAFYWEGPDRQKILVFYQGGYGCWPCSHPGGCRGPRSYQDIIDQLPAMLNQMDDRGSPFSVMRYGGYGCVDNVGPELIVSQIVREWNDKWAYPKLIVATHSMFFERLEKQCENIRTFSGELPDTDYAVGALSTALETSLNRVTHDRLHSAEKFAALAAMLNTNDSLPAPMTYPADEIRDAYDNMLLFDEHTWGKAYNLGTVQDWAWNEKSRYAYKAAGLTETILTKSAGQIAALVATCGNERHVIVFNQLSFQRTDVVAIPKFAAEKSFDLIDAQTGRKVPFQIVELDGPRSPVPHAAGRYALGQADHQEMMSLVFIAENVPAMGYKTYRFETKNEVFSPNIQSAGADISLNGTSIENRFYRVELNPQTGTVTSIYDKESGREMVDKDAPHQVNQLITRWVKTGKEESPVKTEIRKGEFGAVYGSLIVTGSGAGCPQLTQEIILYRGLKRIDFANRVLKDSAPIVEVYFAFPFKIDEPDFQFEGCNSVIKPLRDQFPGSNSNYYSVQHWADVSDGKYGVTLAPRDAHLLEFGGLWPCYVSPAHHRVPPLDFGAPFVTEMTRGHMYSFVIDSNFRTNFQATQTGDMLFRYSVTSHPGDWRQGQPKNFGWSVANPLAPVVVNGEQKGPLPESMSFCRLDKPNVLLTAFKQAEDGRGFIARLTEMNGVETSLTLSFPSANVGKAYMTDLLERDMREIPAQDKNLVVSLMPFGIATVRILFC